MLGKFNLVQRGLRLAAVVGLLAVGVQLIGVTPASAQDASISRVGYTCKATNPTINQSLQGPQQFYVTAKTTLPTKVTAGSTVPATESELTLFMPPKLVNRMMKNMKVERVKGSSTSDVILQAVGVGGKQIERRAEPVRDLEVKNWVPLVADSEISIVANGNVGAVSVPSAPQGNGLIYVQMPKAFVLHSVMDPPVLDSISEADLNCTRDEDTRAARVIGTIPIGDGCSESECPLPASDTEGPTAPVDPPTDPKDPEPKAPIELDKSFDYTCNVIAGGLNLRTHTIGVRSKATVPGSVYPGE
ncbi:MAG TPA: hypothetical protein PLQ19_11525, partial [Aeromicrobium sp.]|nr:hypothetical protein [Aeromicrobium sp.]